MVKADLTRDYYGDLEVSPTAELNEIKKQFKKLALTYHPDRNPGRESEVTAKFQKIQSAHEVLSDAQERAKYDANRVRGTGRYQMGGNQKGNPWSNVSSQYPPPPKAPTARNRAPPPPSAGAQRYKNFEAPRQSANQTAQEGPEARRSTYAAWEHMKNPGTKTGPSDTWNKPGPAPKARFDRDDSGSFKARASHKVPPNYEEFRASSTSGTSPLRRSQSSSAQSRKGFTPMTPGGDEPAAPRTAYSTQRNKYTQPPEPPPRKSASRPSPTPPPPVDPLRQFRESSEVPYEPRLSTPYATHGGEKLNPFETANMNRSKSTREHRDKSESSQHIPRAGSDPNLNSPHRHTSFARSSRHRASYTVPTQESDNSTSESGPEIKPSRRFAKPGKRSPRQSNPAFSPTTQKSSTQIPDNSTGQKSDGPFSSDKAHQKNGETPSIFNFKVDDTTFQRTNTNGLSSSAENINTKFSPEEWEGKFKAGYFQPEQKAANVSHHARARTQSGSRSRGRSPVKSKAPTDPHYAHQPLSESEVRTESSGSAKFSQEEWAGTFKPQTFMPPPPSAGQNPSRAARKQRGSTIKATMGTAALVNDSSDSSTGEPVFINRQSFGSAIPKQAAAPTPDPMDVDPPLVFKPVTPTSQDPPESLKVNTSPSKRPAATSGTASPIDQESLKVNFEEMNIQDLISSMNLPKPPSPPQELQVLNDSARPKQAEYETYLTKVAEYMKNWDLFFNRIMLHLVARKNQNDGLAEKRWTDDKALDTYRLGLREDKAVLSLLSSAEDGHSRVLKAHAIIREKMKDKDSRERQRTKLS